VGCSQPFAPHLSTRRKIVRFICRDRFRGSIMPASRARTPSRTSA